MFNKKLKLEIEGLKAQVEDLETQVEELKSAVASNKKAVFKDANAPKLSKCIDIMRKHGASELLLSRYEELLRKYYYSGTHFSISGLFTHYLDCKYKYYDSFKTFEEYSKSLTFEGIHNMVNLYDIKDSDMLKVVKFHVSQFQCIYELSTIKKLGLTTEQAWLLSDLVMYIHTIDKFKNEKEREDFDREHTQVVIEFMRLYVLG